MIDLATETGLGTPAPAKRRFKIHALFAIHIVALFGLGRGIDLPVSPFLKVGGNYSEFFFRAADLCLDPQKNIYVVGKDEAVIFKMGAQGKLLKKFGGKGQGPGEFQSPRELLWVQDTLWAADFLGNQINLYKNDEFVRSIKHPSAPQCIGRVGDTILVSPAHLDDSFHVYNLEGVLQKRFKVDSGFLETINPKMEELWRAMKTTPSRNQGLTIGLSFQSKILSIDQEGHLTSVWDVDDYYPSYPKKRRLGLMPQSYSARGFAEGSNGLTWVLGCQAVGQCRVIYQFDLNEKKAVKRIELNDDYISLRILDNGSILALIENDGGVLLYRLDP